MAENPPQNQSGRVYDDDHEFPLAAEHPASSPTIQQLHQAESGNSSSSTPAGQSHGGSTSSTVPSSGGGSSTNTGGGLFKAGGGDGKTPSAGDLLGAESVGAKVGNSAQGKSKLVALAGRHKKGFIGGGSATIAIVALAIVFIGSIVAYQIVTMEKTLVRAEAKIVQRFEKIASKQVAHQIACRTVKIGCRGDSNPEDNGKTAQDEAASGDEGQLAENEAKVNFSDPAVEGELAGQGIHVKTVNGVVEGFTDGAGNDITSEIGADDTTFSKFDAALPEWQTAQITTVDPIAVDHSGAVLDPIPAGTTADEAKETVVKDVTEGSSGSTLNEAAAEDNQANDNKPADQGAYNNAKDITGTTGKALQVVEQDIAAGKSEEVALQDGESAFNPGDPIFLSVIASDVCSVKKSADEASKARVPTIMSLLIRHGALILSLADQLKSGKISGAAVNKIMQLWNGNPAATKTDASGNPNEASMPFTKSAAWQRIVGGTVNTNRKSSGYTPDIASSALPTANSGTQVVNEIDGVVNALPGGQATCTVENSIFGGIVNAFVGVAQFLGDDGTFGLLQIGITAGGLAVQETLQHVVIPAILQYFTPVGINGHENSVQWFNNADAGTNLLFNDYSRSIGGQPLTNDQATTLADNANLDQAKQDAHSPWTDRLFATSNPDSLVSRLAMGLPTSGSQILATVGSFFANLPHNLAHTIAMIFSPKKLYAQTAAQAPGAAYGITQYGFTDSDVTKYDPIQNEKYLYGNVTYNGKTARRIDMTGDPNNYQSNMVDTSTTDLLHCFLDGYDSSGNDAGNNSANWSNGNNDSICGSVGSYDYAHDTPSAPSASDPNNSNNTIMTDANVAVAYCNYLAPGDSSCATSPTMLNQLRDDIGHFRQYILDSHVVNDYVSLTSNQ